VRQLDFDVKQRLSLRVRLDRDNIDHIVIDSGRRRFIRLVDDQLNSSLHHRCRHWVNVHGTPVFLPNRGYKMPNLILRLVKKCG
jgi:hypothetical protein